MTAARLALGILIAGSAVAVAGPLDGVRLRPVPMGESMPDTGSFPESFDPLFDEGDGLAELAPLSLSAPWEEAGKAQPLEAPVGPWMPPLWYPEDARGHLDELEGMGLSPASLGPSLGLASRAAFVYDLDRGEVLLALAADERRPVASLTKLVSALSLASEAPDLEEPLCLDLSMAPSWPGAVTRLGTGTCTSGWDLLGAALVRSDNGAALAFPALAGLELPAFVGRMNEVARDLGMSQSTFSDPSGIEDDNLSTARDMTRAVVAASWHPQLGPVLDAPSWMVEDLDGEPLRRMRTTNRLLGSRGRDVLAGKTGYTDTARHCFSAVVETRDGRRVAMTVMGARWGKHRWRDVERILRWVERSG